MSETPAAPEHPTAAEGAKPPKAPNKLLLPLVVTLMTVLGGGLGIMVVAPKLIATRTASAGLEAEPHDGEPAEEGENGGEGGEKGPMFKIDNLIVNPAGSLGSRFLMVSVAVETSDAKVEENLRRREPQIRDVVIALLEQRTMDQLATPGIRDSLKIQLADTITQIAGVKKPLKVFLPQFVIQ